MILQDYIYIEHEELHNVKTNINNKLIEICKHKCTPETGIINKFIEIINISNNMFNPIGNKLVFDVTYKVDNYIPKVGDIIESKIISLSSDSVILSYPVTNPKIKIITTFKGELQPGFIVPVELNVIKYEKETILCLGKLI